MAKIIPTRVKNDVEKVGFELLDEWRYLNRTRVENSQFMDQLASHPKVGKKLAELLDHAGVRKYIKDVIVNKYAKNKRKMPRDLDGELENVLDEELNEIDWVSRDKLSLHRSLSGIYIVTARTTFVKWETGLRKILLYIADKPVLRNDRDNIRKLIAVYEHGVPINEADRRRLERAMKLVGVECIWGT